MGWILSLSLSRRSAHATALLRKIASQSAIDDEWIDKGYYADVERLRAEERQETAGKHAKSSFKSLNFTLKNAARE